MAGMSSFYGGRQGSSFIIYKRFDGIDIPQVSGNYVYTKTDYATKSDGYLCCTTDSTADGAVQVPSTNYYFIKKTSTNVTGEGIDNFYKWTTKENNGASLYITPTGRQELHHLPTELAEGMVQFFSEGAVNTSEVPYGGYVIIDTIYNSLDLTGIDNGKIYRRGLDIDNGLGGAEYIGQITCSGGSGSNRGQDIQIGYGASGDIILDVDVTEPTEIKTLTETLIELNDKIDNLTDSENVKY